MNSRGAAGLLGLLELLGLPDISAAAITQHPHS
jgi:hypothetical protein